METDVKNTLRLFHRATAKHAASILKMGFFDGFERHTGVADYNGVWLTNDPKHIDDAKGFIQLAVDLGMTVDELDKFDWQPREGRYREWLIPSDILNEHVIALVLNEALR